MVLELLPAKGTKEEAEHFARLMELSAPQYFPVLLGPRFRDVFETLFLEKENLFSHEHVVFAVYGGEIAGMLLGYDWKTREREEKRTGWLMLKVLGFDFLRKLPGFIRASFSFGRLEKGDYYISNIAVYPEFRGRKIGKSLMLHAEKRAKDTAERMALDVEKDNMIAIAVYKKLGYFIEREHSVELEGKVYRFYRMVKELKKKSQLTSEFSSR
ncbi:GNAT family N-acetyltransferase [Thermococcus barophilus]|uniref:Ribosomal-protein-alanine acetyltransferase n=1 Tax=Thermococcus barophilus TaxID=55802 RepID=A0A0S1XCV9_THEBA|nr:GNAT family N-acetyltransferase [Thermococcus barophilus]ALM75568.1 ribosomal-protein-alanine acetyltransferase [Thermococcus barophilus]